MKQITVIVHKPWQRLLTGARVRHAQTNTARFSSVLRVNGMLSFFFFMYPSYVHPSIQFVLFQFWFGI